MNTVTTYYHFHAGPSVLVILIKPGQGKNSSPQDKSDRIASSCRNRLDGSWCEQATGSQRGLVNLENLMIGVGVEFIMMVNLLAIMTLRTTIVFGVRVPKASDFEDSELHAFMRNEQRKLKE